PPLFFLHPNPANPHARPRGGRDLLYRDRYLGRKADKNRKIYNGMMKTYYYQFMGPRPPKKQTDN
ncbi:MAG: hypothetical protein K2G55_07350, partial [Lachnospiraceae bacterium]|nr:hypothetical protein [Lachnospiraceae bacterium]